MSKSLNLALAALLLPAGGAMAGEFNTRQHLDPGSNSKVQKVIAQAWQQSAEASKMKKGFGSPCGSQNVGAVQVTPGGAAPREVTTVVLGDAINVVGVGGCR